MPFDRWFHRVRSHRLAARLLQQARQALALLPPLQAAADAELSARFTTAAASARQLPLALALAAEAVRRHTGLWLHAEQLAGSLALLRGAIAEMQTGEGKTLALLPAAAVLAARGQQVHVATANAYLAQRDAKALQPVYALLGVTATASLPSMPLPAKQQAYEAQVVYAPGTELAFDWMRNMLATSLAAQCPLRFDAVIVDEADAVLIDDARTPMVVSTASRGDPSVYGRIWRCVQPLQEGRHYEVDRKRFSASFTEAGFEVLEQAVRREQLLEDDSGLYAPQHLDIARLCLSALQVRALYRRDVDYVVARGEVLIVDESTGRAQTGRRWQDGIHEIVEAREGLDVRLPSATAASITVQSFYNRYGLLAGLTGTALTEAEEFAELYGRQVVAIPTHRPVRRIDHDDVVFLSAAEKHAYLAQEAATAAAQGRPVLIGTGSVEESEAVSRQLRGIGVAHQVLNARQDEDEAEKIARAGVAGMVTVSTNMAGRGTDIVLGADAAQREQILARGGLLVLGASRGESRRADLQLRGRAGRQGDPGESRFYLSLEDPLLRDFGGEALRRAFTGIGGGPGRPLGHPSINRLVNAAQARMAQRAYEARRQAALFDRAVDGQREAFYRLRQALLEGSAQALAALRPLALAACRHAAEDAAQNIEAPLVLKRALRRQLGVEVPVVRWTQTEGLSRAEVLARAAEAAVQQAPPEGQALDEGRRQALLQVLDAGFAELLEQLEELRSGAGLAGMAGRNPQVAFLEQAREAFERFLRAALVSYVQQPTAGVVVAAAPPSAAERVMQAMREGFVERNAACPCGSGRRFRLCHGRPGHVGWLQYG